MVRDEDNHDDLSYAVVTLVELNVTQQAGIDGSFVFQKLCAGSYHLKISHTGCKDTVFTVEVSKSVKLTFRMPHSLNALKELEITTHHTELKSVTQEQVLSQRAADRQMGAPLAEQLKELNGVTTMNTGPGIAKPMLNGMSGYRVLILNNGVRLEGQQWGSEHAPEIDPFSADKMAVVRGAAAVRYGSDAVAGVIVTEPAELPDTAGVTGQVYSMGALNGRGGAVSGRLQGYSNRFKYFSWRVQGTLKRTGDINTPDYVLRNTGVAEKNYAVTMGYHRKKVGVGVYYSEFNSRIGIFAGSHIGNLTDLNLALSRTKPLDSLADFSYQLGRPCQQIQHRLFKWQADVHTGPRSRLYAVYAFQENLRQEYDLPTVGQTAATTPPSQYHLMTHTGELVWEHNYIRSFRGKYGVQGMYQEHRYANRFFIPNYLQRTAGVFAIERFIRNTYELEAGMRYDVRDLEAWYYSRGVLQNPYKQFDRATYNVGWLWKPDSTWRISINAASGWRSPSVNELYSDGLHHGVAAIERGDKQLKTEQCNNLNLSLDHRRKRWSISGSLYTYLFKNFIYYQPSPSGVELTVRGAFPVFEYTQNNAMISGADAVLQYSLSASSVLKARGMAVRGRNTATHDWLIYMPADRVELSWIQTVKDGQRFKEVWVEPTIYYSARQWRVSHAVDFAPPPNAYLLFGVSCGAKIVLGDSPAYVTLSVSNAANTVYRDYLDRFRYYADAQGLNVVLRLRVPIVVSRH
jgi:iron complex outermembrane receptor protein